jgi:chromosome segregation ATPase
MSRELNRELFGEKQSPSSSRQIAKADGPAPASGEDLKMVSFQVDSLNRKLKEYESKLEILSSRWDELSGSSKLRFERIQSHFQRQSEVIQNSFRDVHSKVATIASKLNERKMADTNIREMVDRHQQVVQTFEVRLQQVQKVLSEQELQLMNSRSELKDALKELERLKRG